MVAAEEGRVFVHGIDDQLARAVVAAELEAQLIRRDLHEARVDLSRLTVGVALIRHRHVMDQLACRSAYDQLAASPDFDLLRAREPQADRVGSRTGLEDEIVFRPLARAVELEADARIQVRHSDRSELLHP